MMGGERAQGGRDGALSYASFAGDKKELTLEEVRNDGGLRD